MSTSIQFNGVYCNVVSETFASYMRFYEKGFVIERHSERIDDSKFTVRDFGSILEKGMEKSDMSLLSGSYTLEQDASVRINVEDGMMMAVNEYLGIPSKDGMEMMIKAKKLMGVPMTDIREVKFTFRKFTG